MIANYQHRLGIWIVPALAASVSFAELVEINRFCRTWMQGPWFLRYEFLMIGFLGALLGATVFVSDFLEKRGAVLVFAYGVALGAVSGVTALFASPLLRPDRVKSPFTMSVWLPTFLAAFLSMSWLVGGVTTLVLRWFGKRQMLPMLVLGATAVAVRLSETCLHIASHEPTLPLKQVVRKFGQSS